MINFITLLNVAPFPPEARQDILSKVDQLTEDQKLRLSEAAWQALAMVYDAKCKQVTNDMMQQMARGEKTYQPNDFQEAEAKIFFEFAQKLEAAESEEDIAEVREKLKTIKKT